MIREGPGDVKKETREIARFSWVFWRAGSRKPAFTGLSANRPSPVPLKFPGRGRPSRSFVFHDPESHAPIRQRASMATRTAACSLSAGPPGLPSASRRSPRAGPRLVQEQSNGFGTGQHALQPAQSRKPAHAPASPGPLAPMAACSLQARDQRRGGIDHQQVHGARRPPGSAPSRKPPRRRRVAPAAAARTPRPVPRRGAGRRLCIGVDPGGSAPPSRCTRAIIWSASVVLPQAGGPNNSSDRAPRETAHAQRQIERCQSRGQYRSTVRAGRPASPHADPRAGAPARS